MRGRSPSEKVSHVCVCLHAHVYSLFVFSACSLLQCLGNCGCGLTTSSSGPGRQAPSGKQLLSGSTDGGKEMACGRVWEGGTGAPRVDVLAGSVVVARGAGGGRHEDTVSPGTAYKLHCLSGGDGSRRCRYPFGGKVYHSSSITIVFLHPLTVSLPPRY